MNEAAERLRGSMAGTSQTTADGITWFDPEKELDAALAAERAVGAAQGLAMERLARVALDPRYSDEWIGSSFRRIADIDREYVRLSEPTE